eukprot:4529216-Amphidinium_carterae.2
MLRFKANLGEALDRFAPSLPTQRGPEGDVRFDVVGLVSFPTLAETPLKTTLKCDITCRTHSAQETAWQLYRVGRAGIAHTEATNATVVSRGKMPLS